MDGEVPVITTLFALTLAASDVATFGFGLVIASDTDCPAAADVRDELQALSFPAPDAASVAIHGADDQLTVVFGAPAGLQKGPRTLEMPAECPRRASAAALLIAAWLGELPTRPPNMTLEEGAPSVRQAAPPRPRPVAVQRPRSGNGFESSLAAAVDVIPGASMVPGLSFSLGQGAVDAGAGWALTLFSQLLNAGGAWDGSLHPSAELDLRWRIATRHSRLDLYLGPAVGMLVDTSRAKASRVDFGAGTAVRGTFYETNAGLWWEIRARAWFAKLAENNPDLADVPAAEVLLSMGWTFAL
jgi:hypothetical protein